MITTAKIPSLLSGARSPAKQVATRLRSIGRKVYRRGRAGLIQARRMKHSVGLKTKKMLERPKRYLQNKIKSMAVKSRPGKRFSSAPAPGSDRKASLIKRYHNVIMPKNKENAAKRSARAASIRNFRKQQSRRPAGKQLSARSVIHGYIKRDVKEARSRMSRLAATQHSTMASASVPKKKGSAFRMNVGSASKRKVRLPKKAVSRSFTAAARGRQHGRKTNLLKSFSYQT